MHNSFRRPGNPIAFAAVLLMAAGPARPQQSASTFSLSPDAIDRMIVQADHFELTTTGDVMTATGNVRAEIVQRGKDGAPQQPIVVTADTVSADFTTHVISAQQRVAVETGGHVVRGESATYNWIAQTGRVNAVYAQEYGLAFMAEWVDVAPDREVMHSVVFSACGLDHPDYAVRARSVGLYRNRRVVAYRPTVELFGHRVVTLPRLAYRVRQGQADSGQSLPVPRPGYSRKSGASLSQALPIGENVQAEIEATTRVGLRGMVAYRRDGRISPFVEADWKQERPSRRPTPVLVSRLPEAGIRFGRRNEASMSVGYFREHDTHVSASRANLAFSHLLITPGERPGLRVTVGGSMAAYSTHDTYSTARVEASIGRHRSQADVFEEIGIRENGLKGHTPFQWDEVRVPSEIFAGKRIAWGAWRLETNLRYDAGHHKMYDEEYGLARMFRCLEPEIRYSRRSQAVYMALRLMR